MTNSKKVVELVEKFAAEIDDVLIATGIVSNKGILEAYKIHESRGEGYDAKKSAEILCMISNVFNNTMCEIYDGTEEVTEMLATTNNSYFLYRKMGNSNHFLGVTFSNKSDSAAMRKKMQKYEADFVIALT